MSKRKLRASAQAMPKHVPDFLIDTEDRLDDAKHLLAAASMAAESLPNEYANPLCVLLTVVSEIVDKVGRQIGAYRQGRA
jgi:hypothetical protein